MGPDTLEGEETKPLSLEGKLSREDIPKEIRHDANFSRHSSGGRKSPESSSRKDVSIDVSESEIRDAQLIASLKERIESGDKDAKFELGQFHFEHREFIEAKALFEEIDDEDMRAKYQLAVIYYDGLGTETDHVII